MHIRVQMRIKELIQEKAQLKRKQKELRREHIQLHRDKKAKEQRIAELEGRAYDVQMLKFGKCPHPTPFFSLHAHYACVDSLWNIRHAHGNKNVR